MRHFSPAIGVFSTAISVAFVLGVTMAAGMTAAQAQPQQGQPQQSERPPQDRRAGPPQRPPGQSYANSSAVLVADIAFARLAKDKGQWTAFSETAAPDAITFFGGPMLAETWLQGRADPPEAARWDARRLFMACDGRTGAATGILQFPDGQQGLYTSIWMNLEKPRAKKTRWKWVLNHGASVRPADLESDFIVSRTAVCTGNPKAVLGDVQMGPLAKGTAPVAPQSSGARASADGTMVWRWAVQGDGSRTITIELWNGSAFDTVVRDEIAADAA